MVSYNQGKGKQINKLNSKQKGSTNNENNTYQYE